MSAEGIPPDPPHPTQAWKILGFREGKTKPNPKAPGNLTAYYVDFEGADDGWCVPDGSFWRRKEGNAPTVGETVYGTITPGQYGYSFRMAQDQPRSSQQPSQPNFKAAAGSPSPSPSSPPESHDARQKSIIEQHSQQATLEHLAAAVASGAVEKVEFTPEWADLHIAPMIAWYAQRATSPPDPGDQIPF